MAVREAAITLAALALVATSAQAGLYDPAGNALMDPTVAHEETTVDVASECPGELEVGASAVDITPYDPMSWAEDFEDLDGDGVYDPPDPLTGDPGEPYEDANHNGKFDALFMAGYGHETEGNEYYMATGVHDPVWARAVAITCGETTLGMVSVDTVGLFRGVVEEVREDAPDAFDHVIVAATHTHGSIDTMGLWGPNMFIDGKHPELMERYQDDIVRSLRQALVGQRTVDDVTAGQTRTRDLIDDAGTVQTDLRDPFVVDDRVLATRFTGEDGDTIATIVNWSPHPETLAGTDGRISSDYAHTLREAIETEGATLGGEHREPIGGTTVFFSGAVGGMMTTLGADPLDEAGDPVPQRSYEKAARIGEVAAWAVLDSLASAGPTSIEGLDVQAREINVPADNPFLLALNAIGIFDHEVALGPAEVGPLAPPGVVPPSPFFRAEMNLVTLHDPGGPHLEVFTTPGELLPEVALGNPLSHQNDATLADCYAFNPTKRLFNHDREARPNPDDGGRPTPGFERQLAANPEIPKEPAFLLNTTAEHAMLFGLANDELGYIVPADDYVYPTIAPEAYGHGTDRCGSDDHYEETVSASSYLAPAVATTLQRMLEPGFEPEPYPTRVAGPIEDDGAAPALTEWDPAQTRGVWVDTSRSSGYEAEEDAHVRVGLPSSVPGPGCWGFLNGHGQDTGQQPGEHARGAWFDLDGDCTYEEGDGVLFADAWALGEGQPHWRP